MEKFDDPNHKIGICGVFCGACPAYLKKCLGCRSEVHNSIQKRKSKWSCKKRICASEQGFAHCGECPRLPCSIRKPLDNRYLEKYSINLIENCQKIFEMGSIKWIISQEMKYTCKKCGKSLSPYLTEVHSCGWTL
jgi:hypothetical protein